MPKVYIASKFKHGVWWKKLYEDSRNFSLLSDEPKHPWYGIEFTSRWFKNYAGNVPDEPQFCKIGWVHDVEDVAAADVLIIYAEPEDNLRGALVEVGVALANDLWIIAVGDHPDYGTWQYHPYVHKVNTMDEALQLLRCIDFPETE
jgi:hypothetical protein